MAEVDAGTRQWREMFADQMAAEFKRQREVLNEIRALLKGQDGRLRETEVQVMTKADAKDVQKNALELARLKTWVALAGGGIGVIGVGVALLQALK